MDRFTRKELKSDKFVAEFGHSVEFLQEHRKQATIAGIALVVIVVAVAGSFYYVRHQHDVRQQALRSALRVFEGTVTTQTTPYFVTFPTQEAKNEAVDKAMNEVIEKYPGSDEATIAKYYLALSANAQGKVDDAERILGEVKDKGKEPYASQAAFSLAQLYADQGENEQAEQILRNLIDNPTIMVSKDQATIELAGVIGKHDPAEARKLLEPLRSERSAVSRAALTALGDLPPQ